MGGVAIILACGLIWTMLNGWYVSTDQMTAGSYHHDNASGGDLGLQDGGEVPQFLEWWGSERVHPATVGPGKTEQTRPRRSRSFRRLGAPP